MTNNKNYRPQIIEYLFAVFFIISIVACYFGFDARRKLKEEQAVFQNKMQVLIEANKAQETKLQTAYRTKDSIANYYTGRLDEARKKQQQIKADFKPLYNEINTSPDSAQYSITKQLLAGHAKCCGK